MMGEGKVSEDFDFQGLFNNSIISWGRENW